MADKKNKRTPPPAEKPASTEAGSSGAVSAESAAVPGSGLDLRQEFGALPALLLTLKADGTVADINPTGERLLGFPKEKMVGQEWVQFVPGRYREAVKKTFAGLMAGDLELYGYYENPVVSADGREIPIGWNNAVMRDSAGQPIGTISVGVDIGEMVTARRARERLLSLEEKLAETFSLDQALESCLETALSLSPAFSAGGLYLLEENDRLELQCHKGLSDAFIKEVGSYGPGDAQWEAVMKGKPLYGTFTETEPRRSGVRDKEGLKSLGIVPIVYAGKVIGDLNIASRVAASFTEAEKEWIRLLAGSVGGAISRIRLQEKLAASEWRLREFIEGAEDILYSLDKEGQMVFTSPQVERYGWKATDLIGQSMIKVIHPDDQQKIVDDYMQMMNGKKGSSVIEFRAIGSDGKTHWMESASRVRYGPDGKSIIGSSGVLRDITQRVTERRAREQSEARFRTLVENIGDIIFELSLDGRVKFVSRQIDRLHFDVNDVFNKPLVDLVVPEDRDIAIKSLEEIVSSAPSAMTTAVRIMDGQDNIRWLEATAALRETADGSRRIFGAMRDVTDRKEAEGELIKEREKYRRVFESSNDAIMLLTADKFFDCNEATARVFGYASKEDFLGKHPGEVSPPYQADGTPSKDAANERIATAFREGKNFFEWTYRRADGTDFPATVLLTPLELEGETVLQATVRDITKEKEAERRIRALDQLKTRFITTLTHITRTPLNRIRWSLESIDSGQFHEGMPSEEEKALIHQALESEDEVLRVIDSMNTALDIERDTLVLDKAPASIVSLVRSVKDRYAQMPEMSEVEWVEEIPEKKLGIVSLDSARMRMALTAIFDNVLKYRGPDKNRIVIKLEKKGGRVRCSIKDSGIGIPPDELPYVFQRFFRASNAQLKYTEGTGLGLYIAKAVVEKHGGSMGIESAEGEGTTVWFDLPMG